MLPTFSDWFDLVFSSFIVFQLQVWSVWGPCDCVRFPDGVIASCSPDQGQCWCSPLAAIVLKFGGMKTHNTCPFCPEFKPRNCFRCYFFFEDFFFSLRKTRFKQNLLIQTIKQQLFQTFSENVPDFMKFRHLCKHFLELLEWQSELAV